MCLKYDCMKQKFKQFKELTVVVTLFLFFYFFIIFPASWPHPCRRARSQHPMGTCWQTRHDCRRCWDNATPPWIRMGYCTFCTSLWPPKKKTKVRYSGFIVRKIHWWTKCVCVWSSRSTLMTWILGRRLQSASVSSSPSRYFRLDSPTWSS